MATARQITKAYNDRFASLGLNLTTASILAYVNDFGPVTQTQIADHLGHGRAATGSSIDRLAAEGFVERTPDPSDRRVWLISTTTASVPVLAAIDDIDRAIRSGLRSGISREQRQELAALLGRIQHNLIGLDELT